MPAAYFRSIARRGTVLVCTLAAITPLLTACDGRFHSSVPEEKSDFQKQWEADEEEARYRRDMEEQEAESLRRQAENLARLQAVADQQGPSQPKVASPGIAPSPPSFPPPPRIVSDEPRSQRDDPVVNAQPRFTITKEPR